jgi:hypothetical protein
MPAVQALQAPPKHTSFAPQLVPSAAGTVPSATGMVPSTQVALPVAHEVTPFTHGFGLSVQALPEVQALHTPPLHTASVPQLVPFGSALALSTQVCVPVAQESTPVLHGSGLVVQAPPAAHAVHDPPLQT